MNTVCDYCSEESAKEFCLTCNEKFCLACFECISTQCVECNKEFCCVDEKLCSKSGTFKCLDCYVRC